MEKHAGSELAVPSEEAGFKSKGMYEHKVKGKKVLALCILGLIVCVATVLSYAVARDSGDSDMVDDGDVLSSPPPTGDDINYTPGLPARDPKRSQHPQADALNCSTYIGDEVQFVWDFCHDATHIGQAYGYCLDSQIHSDIDLPDIVSCREHGFATKYCHECPGVNGPICSSLPDAPTACASVQEYPVCSKIAGQYHEWYQHITGCYDNGDFMQEWRRCSTAGSDVSTYSRTVCPWTSPCKKCGDGVTLVCANDPTACGEHSSPPFL